MEQQTISEDRIKEYIEIFKRNKEKSNQYNTFGEDVHIFIDVAIEILSNKNLRSDSAIEEYYGDDWNKIEEGYSVIELITDDCDIEDYLLPEIR